MKRQRWKATVFIASKLLYADVLSHAQTWDHWAIKAFVHKMNSKTTLCFSHFSVLTDVGANCFQFMLIDAKDKNKTRGEGTKITPKHINMTCLEFCNRNVY